MWNLLKKHFHNKLVAFCYQTVILELKHASDKYQEIMTVCLQCLFQMSCSIMFLQINQVLLYHPYELKHDMGAQWLSGRVLDSRPRGRGF